MKKHAYIKPLMSVLLVEQQGIICTSDWDVMGPGDQNAPAGARSFDDWEEY